MKIQLLHTADCHAWREGLSVLEEALKTNGLEVKYKVVLVETSDQAQTYKFAGSPTIQIDGVDVDPMAKNITLYSVSSCRPYFYQRKSYDYPPREMITDALKGSHQEA